MNSRPIYFKVSAPEAASPSAGSYWGQIWGVTLIVIGLLTWLVYASQSGYSPKIQAQAVLLIVISSLPLLYQIKKGFPQKIPVFAFHCAYYGLGYGIAVFFQRPRSAVQDVSDPYVQLALWYVLLAVLMVMLGYWVGHLLFKEGRITPFHIGNWLDDKPNSRDLVLCSIYFVLLFSADYIPSNLMQVVIILENLCLSSFISAAALGEMRKTGKLLWFCLFLPLSLLLAISAGVLGSLATIVLFYISVNVHHKKRFPLWIATGGLLILILFNPIKGEFRTMTYESSMSRWDKFELYWDMAWAYYSDGPRTQNTGGDTIERLLDLAPFSAVIYYTPNLFPYLNGETFIPMLTKFIPRAIYPDKPEDRVGNIWGKRYGFVAEQDDKTWYNMPWLVEMYINFGIPGIMSMMFLTGLLIVLLSRIFVDGAVSVVEYGVAIIILRPLIYPHGNLSNQLGGILLNIIFICFFLKPCMELFGKRMRHKPNSSHSCREGYGENCPPDEKKGVSL